MSRYIDANEITKEKLIEFVGGQNSISFDDLLWMIKDYMPTADVVEVVHARWEDGRYNSYSGEYEECCSHCKSWSVEFDKPYCPNCGAKMDGKKVE